MVLRIFTESIHLEEKDESGYIVAQERVIVSAENQEYRLETRFRGKSYFYEIKGWDFDSFDEPMLLVLTKGELICSDFDSYLNEISNVIKFMEDGDKKPKKEKKTKKEPEKEKFKMPILASDLEG